MRFWFPTCLHFSLWVFIKFDPVSPLSIYWSQVVFGFFRVIRVDICFTLFLRKLWEESDVYCFRLLATQVEILLEIVDLSVYAFCSCLLNICFSSFCDFQKLRSFRHRIGRLCLLLCYYFFRCNCVHPYAIDQFHMHAVQ